MSNSKKQEIIAALEALETQMDRDIQINDILDLPENRGLIDNIKEQIIELTNRLRSYE